jgi:S-adenosylmethionine synthetase
MNLYITKKNFSEPIYEFVERKGIGHPDTLADALAEHLSVNYSRYTKKRFGAILHHNL